jgi:hypothetical protein
MDFVLHCNRPDRLWCGHRRDCNVMQCVRSQPDVRGKAMGSSAQSGHVGYLHLTSLQRVHSGASSETDTSAHVLTEASKV